MSDDKKHEAPKVEEKKPEVKHADKCVAVRGNAVCPKCGWSRLGKDSKEPHIAQ